MTRRRSGPGPDLTADAVERVHGRGPVTWADLTLMGITRSQLRSALAAGTMQRHSRGLVTVASTTTDPHHTHLLALRAAFMALPRAVTSHGSALVVHGLPTPHGVPTYPQVTIPPSRLRCGPAAHVHTSPLDDCDIVTIDGTPVTSIARTAVDVARRCSVFDAQIVIDAAARLLLPRGDDDVRLAARNVSMRRSALADLRDVTRRQAGWPGIRVARRAVSWAEPAAESPAESISRVRFHLWELPAPECGVPIVGDDDVTYWADFVWPDQRVIGECDGQVKYTDPSVLVSEKRRQLALERAGWRVVRWLPGEVLRADDRVRRLISDALEIGGLSGVGPSLHLRTPAQLNGPVAEGACSATTPFT